MNCNPEDRAVKPRGTSWGWNLGGRNRILLAINKNDVELDLVYFNWQDIGQRRT